MSNAGGLGILAIASYTPDQVRRDIREIRKLTDKPFGINQILVSPLAKANIDVVIEEKVPIVNYSLERPWSIYEWDFGYWRMVAGHGPIRSRV